MNTTHVHDFRAGELVCLGCLGHRDDCDCPRCEPSEPPACPSWCELDADDHPVIESGAGGVAYIHRRQTSDPAAPYLVRVEWVQEVSGPWPAVPGVVYVEDAHGEDITADEARAMARALTDAADALDAARVEAGQR